MSRTFICSTGTSAAKLVVDDAGKRLVPGKLREWVDAQGAENVLNPENNPPRRVGELCAPSLRGGILPAVQRDVTRATSKILATFQDYEPCGDNLTEKLSAEIHSLARMQLEVKDRVLLLASDTAEGLACAKAVEGYLERHWIGLNVVTEAVPGLQVDDAEQFRRVGVVEFTRRCLREIGDYQFSVSRQSSNVVLNPTGGFKALVPYTVLIGMLKNVPCRYIFEQSSTLLELPPLPVEFSRSRFEAFKPLFERIERDSSVSLADWNAGVPFDDRASVEPLIEQIDQAVTLSALGLLFLDEVRTTTRLVPFLSRQAWTECWDNLRQLVDCDPFRFLTRMSAPPLLAEKTHINVGHGLRWLKPGRTTDRYLVSVEGWRLLVWRAIREDQVGGDYAQQIVIDPQRDRARYAPFTRLEFSP